MTIDHRVKEIRNKHGLTHTAFAKIAGVSRQLVYNWYNQGTSPSADAVLRISRTLDISPYWFLYGKGDMYVVKGQQEKIAELLVDLSDADKELLEIFLRGLRVSRALG
ncbi:hypothetical protein GP2143_02519 [marine gamma proteobacterium HTCC2143]|jgi:transcriptional regulator with XRE-family HTH domain|uniref:HTH cro/C1-type domain-containing protein n=1 Tax=marine gamma proteobacterium HTCC2143 TaxID=247633 RepID=A0YEC5_9GAMM|nr:hypothetical protein GP2143_02519 [marine gamma proteobacterium HTCC2143]|tara:strand:- start:97 stop:420 length:324 start_codon:yes stop_codon:yes gene_type:complete